ncbi:MAG: hypothetical protein Q7J30_01470, partial [Candidatus Azambacteria bacterium]|nr:hypothetical protein [Candidatus Azambacteria bacterium]
MSGFFAPNNALAVGEVTINPATGAENVSIDTTSFTGGTGVFTDLSGPVLTETSAGGISVGSHTITLPAGWEFNTGSTVTVFSTL